MCIIVKQNDLSHVSVVVAGRNKSLRSVLTFRSLERSETSLKTKLKETLDVLKQREEKHKRSDQELRDKLNVRAQCAVQPHRKRRCF